MLPEIENQRARYRSWTPGFVGVAPPCRRAAGLAGRVSPKLKRKAEGGKEAAFGGAYVPPGA